MLVMIWELQAQALAKVDNVTLFHAFLVAEKGESKKDKRA